jgi:hypothetical protein
MFNQEMKITQGRLLEELEQVKLVLTGVQEVPQHLLVGLKPLAMAESMVLLA